MSDSIDGRTSGVQQLDPRNQIQKTREVERKTPEVEFKKVVEAKAPDVQIRKDNADEPAAVKSAQVKAEKSERPDHDQPVRRAEVASAAVIVSAPESLSRHDQNADGRIDQLEQRSAIRAEAENSTYHALSQYRRALNFTEELPTRSDETVEFQQNVNLISEPEAEEKLFADASDADKKLFADDSEEDKKLFAEDATAKKLFAEEVAGAEKLSDKQIETLRKIYNEEELAAILRESDPSEEPEGGSGNSPDDSIEVIV